MQIVDAGSTGPLAIASGAPTGAAVETSALTGALTLSTSSGGTVKLNLGTNTVSAQLGHQEDVEVRRERSTVVAGLSCWSLSPHSSSPSASPRWNRIAGGAALPTAHRRDTASSAVRAYEPRPANAYGSPSAG